MDPPEIAPPQVIPEKTPLQEGSENPPINQNPAIEEEANFMKELAEMQKLKDEQTPPTQSVVTDTDTNEDVQKQRLAIEEEQMVQSENPPEDVPTPQNKPILMKENKSFFAAILNQIKSVITAPVRALEWARGKVNGLRESINAVFRPPQIPPKAV